MEIMKCPLCQCPVRIVRREDGAADHYEAVEDFHQFPNPISPILADFLRVERQEKRTIAIVGSSWTTGPWAPWSEDGVEVWGMNDFHGLPWFEVEGIARWFQMHDRDSFAKKREHNHWEWLQEEHPFPIYMQKKFDDIPNSIPYPLREIQRDLMVYRGEERIEKLFSSTMCYQMALALHEDVDRIEIYGIELVGEGRYAYQREGMAFWMGKADGMGIEVWIPEACALLDVPLYGYETKVGEH